MPITPYTGTFGTPQLKHLLRRTMFGLKKADLTFFAGKSMNEVVTTLLTPPATLTNPLNNYNNPVDSENVGYGSTWVNPVLTPSTDTTLVGNRHNSLYAWWAGAMAYQERSIQWKMTMFWYNHLPVHLFTGDVNDNREAFKYVRHIQTFALGNFKAFIQANARIYPMLQYLNGNQNTEKAPNENYGRELQELFTVGKDLADHYTEADVKAAARVMTGWTFVTSDTNPIGPRYTVYFNDKNHDLKDKEFSAFYGQYYKNPVTNAPGVITGRSGTSAGDLELTALMNMIFAQPEVARYIVRKIYRYFVYYDIPPEITSDLEVNVIGPLADTFRSSGYDIPTVMRALLTSQHFYEPAQMGCLIKSPVDLVMGTARIFDVPPYTDQTDVDTVYKLYLDLYNYCTGLRMQFTVPPNVAGWPAYYSAPGYHEIWINSDTLGQRRAFANSMTTGANTNYWKFKLDVLAFTATLTNPADPNALVEEVLDLALPIPVDAPVKAALRDLLRPNAGAPDYYWTNAWNNYVTTRTDTNNTVRTLLRKLYYTIMDMAEFNLC